MTLNTTLPVLGLGLVVGITALALIANELGKRANLPVGLRFLLSGGLGLGVLSVGIKVLIIMALSQIDGHALAAAGKATRQEVTQVYSDVTSKTQVVTVEAPSMGFRTWRSLPDIPPDPRDNHTTPAKVALGRILFHDTNLSVDRSLSCASCHNLKDGGDDDLQFSVGYLDQTGDRNAPTVLNAAFLTRLFWDGRATSLEAQALGPLLNPVEMAMPSLDAVEARVHADPEYREAFGAVFPGERPITIRNIAHAIAAYERSLVTPDTPYDRFIRGDDDAIPPAAQRGMALFDEIGCRACHVDPVFSAAGTEKTMGTYRRFPVHIENNHYLDQYELLVDGRPARYRVPSLRNVALTAPYFHNGTVESLEEAIRVMAVSQLGRVISDDPISDLRVVAQSVNDGRAGRNVWMFDNRALSDREISDIATFLRTLTAVSIPD